MPRLTPARKRRLLLEKIGRKGWHLEALLAYCQGLAYEAALGAATTLGPGGQRLRGDRDNLARGLRAMVAELTECLGMIEGER